MFTPPGTKDWIKEYEVGPKLAAFTAGLPLGPYVGAGVGSMILGTTESAKAMAEGRPWYKGAIPGMTQGFGIGGGGGYFGAKAGVPAIAGVPKSTLPLPWGAKRIPGGPAVGGGEAYFPEGGYLKGGQMFDKAGNAIEGWRYAPGKEATVLSALEKARTGADVASILSGGGAGVTAETGRGEGVSRLLGPALAGGAGIASLTKEAPEFDYATATERFEGARDSMIQKYLGEAGLQLPRAVREQYLDLATQPMGEMGEVWKNWVEPQWNSMQDMIGKSWDDYDKAIDEQFAQAGGTGSSDHLKAKEEARASRTEELSQARQELYGRAFREQLNVKLDALQRAASQGQFDMSIALELAKLGERDQELLMSIESQNYDQFQDIMGKIMSMGMYDTLQPQWQRMMPSLTGGGR
jgi:hypothetical protein